MLRLKSDSDCMFMNEEQTTDYAIKLDIFEGPLDLLLYLIKKNEIDIYNIPVALITEQYLQYLKIIKSLNLDLAGEYLVMASTLIHIKSRCFCRCRRSRKKKRKKIPAPNWSDSFWNIRHLKKQRQIWGKGRFWKEMCLPGQRFLPEEIEKSTADEEELIEVSIFELIEAFHRLVSRIDKKELLEIDLEKIVAY